MTDAQRPRKRTGWIVLWAALCVSLIANAYQGYRIHQQELANELRRAKRNARTTPRAELYAALPMDSTSIVLFGDSHFEYFPASEMLDVPNIKNRGLSGQTTRDLIDRSAEIVRAKPRTIALCIGINDINRKRSLEELAHDVAELIDILHNGSPGTRLVVLSIPPNENAPTQAKLLQHNAWLEQWCAAHGAIFLDVTTPLMKDGAMDPAVTYDGLHLNAKGYGTLASLLRTHL